MRTHCPNFSGYDTAFVLPLIDPAIADSGFDARSEYVELFWLPILGPSCVWLLRHCARRFDMEPKGFEFPIADTAAAIGIRTNGGKHNAFHRTIDRLISFGMGRTIDDRTIELRKIVPQLHQGQLARLDERMRHVHEQRVAHTDEERAEVVERARGVAATLLELGDSPDSVEEQLIRWGISPGHANEAVNIEWAQRAREAIF